MRRSPVSRPDVTRGCPGGLRHPGCPPPAGVPGPQTGQGLQGVTTWRTTNPIEWTWRQIEKILDGVVAGFVDLFQVPPLSRVVCRAGRQRAPVRSLHALRALVEGELAASGRTQADICDAIGISQKHLSRFLVGRDGMSLDLVDRVLTELDRQLVLSTTVRNRGDGP